MLCVYVCAHVCVLGKRKELDTGDTTPRSQFLYVNSIKSTGLILTSSSFDYIDRLSKFNFKTS